MKLLAIIGLIHYEPEIKKILKKANITIYSKLKVNGHSKSEEDENLVGNWFAMSEGDQKSIMFFSFTKPECATEALKLVSEYNESIKSKSRVRAFIMPVDQHI